MNRDQAIARAQHKARLTQEPVYVFYEPEAGYQLADDFDANTWFLGQEPTAAINPDGEVWQ